MIALDVLLNHASKGWKVINEVRQALMADNVDVPLVEVIQHPRVSVCPSIGIATNVHVHDLDLCQSSCQSVESVEENLLRVDPVIARSAIVYVPRWVEELVLHRLELASKIEGHIETTQLTPVKARHLQRSCIGEIVNAEALPAGKLRRSFLLLEWDIKEDGISNLDGMQQAKEIHQYDGYGVNSCGDCIIVNVVCVRHGLDSQDKQELLSHCCNERQDCGEGDLEGDLQVGFAGTEVEPVLI